MPFVLRSGETWIKNNGSDFFLDFSTRDARNIKAIASVHFTLQTSYASSASTVLQSLTCKTLQFVLSQRTMAMLVKALLRRCWRE